MRLLLTSDTQAEFSNLDLCEVALKELLRSAKKNKPDAIIHAGDLKEPYNPIDLRITKFWVRWTKLITSAGFRFIILLGNHDRISQSVDSTNWLSILQAAGAEIVTRPRWKKIGDGHVAFLPYTPDKKQEHAWAKELVESKDASWASPLALLFHTEIAGAALNSYGTEAQGNDLSALYIDCYDAAFGGHLHGHQQVAKNCWYIGSPFCMSWNEANQPKGHLFALLEKHAVKVTQVRTSIPGWYEADFLSDYSVTPEPGAYIRSKVAVTSKKISQQLRAEEERLRQLYGDKVRLYVVPSLEAADTQEISLSGSTDSEKVEQYVAATISIEARFRAEQATRYLSAKLSATGPEARGHKLRFIRAEAFNVLSFHKIVIDYAKQGLVLLKGINRDWPGQSNGSGKTNALSLLPVAMFGETLKGQKHDEWKRENGNEVASVKLLTRGGESNDWYEVQRMRPHALYFRVNGVDQSSGLTGKEKNGSTQAQIEEMTGFDSRVLLNSVYIDQTISNGFLFGTQAYRMGLLSKLMSLERFDAALEMVKADIKKHEAAESAVGHTIDDLERDMSIFREQLKELEEQVEHDWAKKKKAVEKELAVHTKEHAALAAVQHTYTEKQEELDQLVEELQELENKRQQLRVQLQSCNQLLRRGEGLLKAGKCDQCGQPTKTAATGMCDAARAQIEQLTPKIATWEKAIQGKTERATKLRKAITSYTDRMKDLQNDLAVVRSQLKQIDSAAEDEKARNEKILEKRDKLNAQLKHAQRKMRAAEETLKNYDVEREMLEYAKKAFMRSGMPLYLSAALCPMLNRAAEEYSELFFDGKTKVQFVVQEGEFVPQIVNPTGSATAKGQSVGESAMASVIAAMALREAAPRTNLLIMDEPGHGLDAEAAKQFAAGLVKLKERFETIIVTTHHPAIEAVLSGEKVWTVVKQNGKSKLLTGGASAGTLTKTHGKVL